MNDKHMTDLNNLRHSCAHLLAKTVLEMYPGSHNAIGPSIENGFYQDFDMGTHVISDADLPKIEQRMRQILPSWTHFEFNEVTLDEARKLFSHNPYKIELLEEFATDGKKLLTNNPGDFLDLCKMGHVENPSLEMQHFKLQSVAGAYWRGNEKNKMLTRIYGTCWPTQKELDEYLNMLEESKKRDHRKLGKDLELFTFAEEIGPGLPLWLPKGTIIKDELEKWGKETESKWGYQRVSTPFLTKRELFVMSGHVPYFEDEMYKVQVPGEHQEDSYFVRPMNCPFHHMIYKSKTRSYRDLPLKLAEYGTVARYENAGAINGILRPRLFCQNDAHIYCAEDQAVDVFVEIINLHKYYYDTLGLKNYYIVLALRDPNKKDKYHGEEELWQKSEQLSREAMDKAGIKYVVQNEGAAHYGPKMDFKIKSVIGTEYGISTNQIDLFMPRRFDLKYTDADGKEKYVVVQHRAPLGSSERFVGFLIEHYAGAFPLWLAPIQVVILPISDKFVQYAQSVLDSLKSANIRAELNDKNEPLNARIRDAEMQKIPYILVVGDKEVESESVSIRHRGQKESFVQKLQEFTNQLKADIINRI